MATNPTPTPLDKSKNPGAIFQSREEFDTFLVKNIDERVGPTVEQLLQKYTAKQQTLMGDALAQLDRKSATPKPDAEKGLMLGRQARAMALGKGDIEKAIFEVKRQWAPDDPILKGLEFTKNMTAESKNLSAGNAGGAGNLIDPVYSTEFIELLRNQTVIRGLPGIRVLPMPSGAMGIRKQSAAGTAYYVGEATNITKSDQAVGLLNMVYRKLGAITVVSNDLLRMSGARGVAADAFVRDDLLAVSAIREDLALLRGSGSAYEPTGIRFWAANSNVFASAGTSLANTQSDLAKAVRLVEQGNVPVVSADGMDNPGNAFWIMAPRTRWGIYNLTATTGNYVFRSEMDQGRLLGYGFRVTNQVPINISGSGSEVYFVHAPSCVIGDALGVQIEAFQNGAYYDGSVVVSGISTDETVIRALREHDFALRHDVGASVDTGITLS